MILRIPDYYRQFACIADKCKDCCCIGWEIDIDEETFEKYSKLEGKFGDSLRNNIGISKDNEHCFKLTKDGRCPFLDSRNLCQVYINIGEDALGNVCGEYPRFAIEYGNVLQKCLSLACEEVARIVFTKEDKICLVDEIEETLEEEMIDERVIIAVLEKIQEAAIDILQKRELDIDYRMKVYLSFLQKCQEKMNDGTIELEMLEGLMHSAFEQDYGLNHPSYDDFFARFTPFCEMELLDSNWSNIIDGFKTNFTEENYSDFVEKFTQSKSYKPIDYEKLMVYFTIRYLMNAVYDYDLLSYGKLAVVFTLVIKDMDVLRYNEEMRESELLDRIKTVKIFSKEVEHSQDNIDYIREEFLFDEIFSYERLLEQI